MIRKRFAVCALQLLLAFQAAVTVTVSPAVPAALVRAAGACEVTSEPGSGVVSSCPDASSYADLASGFSIAMDQLRGENATSSLAVTSQPDGATVLLNGIEYGLTPLDLSVPAGSYLVRVTMDGFASFSTTATIAADRPGTVSATLEPTGGGTAGSYNWVRADTLIGLVGGYPDGPLEITDFVRDKHGDYFISFWNGGFDEIDVEPPRQDMPPWIGLDRNRRQSHFLYVSGVARSSDDGASWTLVHSWRNTWSRRGWNREFVMVEDPEHSLDLKVYYLEESYEYWSARNLVPLPDGGVSILLTHRNVHNPQLVAAIWDFVGDCRDCHTGAGHLLDDLGREGTYRYRASAEAQATYGMQPDDLATYNEVITTEDITVNSGAGAGIRTTVPDVGPRSMLSYQGSYEGTDYFLAHAMRGDGLPARVPRHVFTSRDAGRTLALAATYELPVDVDDRFVDDELRIGPDGTLYVVDQFQGGVYIIENGDVRLLGSRPEIRAGYGNHRAYTSAAFDSGGNLHGTFRGPATPNDYTSIKVFYQYFPREPVSYSRVALVTESGCSRCDEVRAFLDDAEIAFTENPSDLTSDVAASVGAEVGSRGYPVLVRLGAESVVRGGADAPSVSRLLGASHPVLVEEHAPRAPGSTEASLEIRMYPQWVHMIVEDDKPRILLERPDGVVVFAHSRGEWIATPVLDIPPSVHDLYAHRQYPLLPGGSRLPANDGAAEPLSSGPSTPREMPFNHLETPGEFVYLYNSATTFNQNNMDVRSYTLWTTKPPKSRTAASFRAVGQASQLIPAAVFYVALSKGAASAVTGELAPYVTQQGVVQDDGDAFYRVVADLRRQNETATDGNITNRVIDGSITVETTVEGVPETREISLALIVNNTRLRVADLDTSGRARDITAEAVHFTGPDEHWVVTNNLALPNSIPCGPDQALLLDPNSVASFTGAEVRSFELGSCLDALEVQPTVITGCQDWEDAKLVLAAQTIDALAQSLSLVRSEDITNYEQAFGGKDAVIHRIVSLDIAPPRGGGPRCTSEVDERSAAVVKISGRILGGDEPYQPTLTLVDQGTASVQTSSRADVGNVAWEREWLELEATFLEASLRTSIADAALASLMLLSEAGKKLGYQRQLLATRAFLHCNYEGHDLATVRLLIARNAAIPEAIRGIVACLHDFVVNPTKHWRGYDRRLWAGGGFESAFVVTVINSSLASNPTMAFLLAAASGNPVDYGEFVIERAGSVEARAGGTADAGGLATDLALDHYARLATVAARELDGTRGAITKMVVLSSDVERLAIRAVLDCARTFGGANPFPKLIELTHNRSYTAGVPCVDAKSTGALRIEAYRRLGYGLRSGAFAALFEAAGRDLDLLYSHLEMAATVIRDVQATEGRYPEGTNISAWQATLPPVDRLVIAERHVQAIVGQRGHRLTVGEAAQILAGVVECGAGLVKGLFSGEGILLLGFGFAAMVAGPFSAAGAGVVFLGSGVTFTGLASDDLTQAWESLDLASKTAGLCGVAAGALMTVAAARPTAVALTPYVAKLLRAKPPKLIDIRTLVNRGRNSGRPLAEQAEALSPRGGAVGEVANASVPPEQALRAILNALSRAKGARIRQIAEQLRFGEMSAEARTVFDSLARAYGAEDGVAGVLRMRQETINKLALDAVAPKILTPELTAQLALWSDIGGAVALELMPGRPKSLRVEAGPKGLVGSDADYVRAALGDGFEPSLEAAHDRGLSTEALRSSASLVDAYLRSPRFQNALTGAPFRRVILTAEETQFLISLQKAARPQMQTDLLLELGGTRILGAVREGIATAKRLAGVPDGTPITSIEATYLASGRYKSAFRLSVKLQGRDVPIEVAIKKGLYSEGEYQLLRELGQKDLTQRPLLTDIIGRIDGADAFSVEEFVPGKQGGLTQNAPESSAYGEFDALLFLRTVRGAGNDARAYYNADLHGANMKLYDVGGRLKGRAIDFDPRFTKQVETEPYFAASILRRRLHSSFAATNEAYFQGFVDAFAREPGSSGEAGLAVLRQVSRNVRNPDFLRRVLDIQSFPLYTDLGAFERAAVGVGDAIDAYLARQ